MKIPGTENNFKKRNMIMAKKPNANPMKDSPETINDAELQNTESTNTESTDKTSADEKSNDDAVELVNALDEIKELQAALNAANDEIEALTKKLDAANAPAEKVKEQKIKGNLVERVIQFHIPVRGALQTKPKVQEQWNELCAEFVKLQK